MTKPEKALAMMVAAILTTVRESGNWSPLSPLMLALNLSLDSFMRLMQALQNDGFVTLTSETVTLTDKGKAMADLIASV